MAGSYQEVRLIKFSPPLALNDHEMLEARRRFCTLLEPPQKGGFGGNAYVRRVWSSDHTLELALKMPQPDAQPEQELLNLETLKEECRTLSVVSNLRGFLTSTASIPWQTTPLTLLMEWVDGISLLGAQPALYEGRTSRLDDFVAAEAQRAQDHHVHAIARSTFCPPGFSMRNIMLRIDQTPLKERMVGSHFDARPIDMDDAKLVNCKTILFEDTLAN